MAEVNLSENNSGPLVGTASVFLACSWLSVALRIYTRAFLTKSIQWDDWLILLGQATFTTYAGFLFAGISAGIGRHNAAIKDDHIKVLALKWQSISIGIWILAMMLIKLSIGIFLLRISVKPIYVWILRVSIVVVAVWSTVLFFWNLFQCNPIEKQWDYRIGWGTCVHPDEIVNAAYAISALSIVSDFLYALIPIPMLWNVKMSKQAKGTVIVILGLGLFASVATLVRIRFLPDMENTDDLLYAGTPAMIWTVVEPGLAIVASSLATIRPLLRAMRIRGFDSTEQRQHTATSSQNPVNTASKRSQAGSAEARSRPLPNVGEATSGVHNERGRYVYEDWIKFQNALRRGQENGDTYSLEELPTVPGRERRNQLTSMRHDEEAQNQPAI